MLMVILADSIVTPATRAAVAASSVISRDSASEKSIWGTNSFGWGRNSRKFGTTRLTIVDLPIIFRARLSVKVLPTASPSGST